MKIYLICSKTAFPHVAAVRAQLESRGHIVTPPNEYDNPTLETQHRSQSSDEYQEWKASMIRADRQTVAAHDAVLVLNFAKHGQENYIGGATFLELSVAALLGKQMYLYNPVPESMLKDEIIGLGPLVLDQDLDKIQPASMPSFTSRDRRYMAQAIAAARQGMERGNYPCGAVLVANDEVIGEAYNLKETNHDRISHAEQLLYIKHSALLKQKKATGARLVMYTTLEPCIMCFGAALIHRIDEIVVASPDPYGNMSNLSGDLLGEFYQDALPKLVYGLGLAESQELLCTYLAQKGGDESRNLIELFAAVRAQMPYLAV